MGGEEGPLSAVSHLSLTLIVSYHILSDPFGCGTRILLTFLIAATLNLALKQIIKQISITWFGHDSPNAFWRRPEESGRPQNSPGFPSSHTSNTGAVWWVLLYDMGMNRGYTIVPTVMMAIGRYGDGSHTFLQTFGGVWIGPLIGVFVRYVLYDVLLVTTTTTTLEEDSIISDGSSPIWWLFCCALCVVGGVVFLVCYEIPTWRATFKSYRSSVVRDENGTTKTT